MARLKRLGFPCEVRTYSEAGVPLKFSIETDQIIELPDFVSGVLQTKQPDEWAIIAPVKEPLKKE